MIDDLYEQLADAIRPEEAIIRDITADARNYGIVVTCEIENGSRPYKVYHVNADDVAEWIEDNRAHWLEWTTDRSHPVTGEHLQDSGTIDVHDFVTDHMTDMEWHEYLIDNNYTNLPYERD